MSPDESLQQLSVFYGETNPVEVRVYARLPTAAHGEYALRGTIAGPFCAHARTLPAQIPLRLVEAGDYSLVEGMVPDPCFWSPELPNFYRLNLELTCGQQRLGSSQRIVGLRPLGPRGNNLFYEGRRWVMRAASSDLCSAPTTRSAQFASTWRAASLACVTEILDPEFAETASRDGLLLIGRYRARDASSLKRSLQSAACWPAVAMAWIETAVELPADVGRAVPNLLLGYSAETAKAATSPPPWAHLRFCSADLIATTRDRQAWPTMPTVAVDRSEPFEDPHAARSACEALQRTLAPYGDFAGYIRSNA